MNLWLNTLLAVSLIWPSVIGTMSWWLRRPKREMGAPPKSAQSWQAGIIVVLGLAVVLLPIFGLSVAAIGTIGWIAKRSIRMSPT